MIWPILLSVAAAILALSPALLAVRLLVKPAAVAEVSWWRLAGPAALGIAVGAAVATLLHALHSGCGNSSYQCLQLLTKALVLGVPLTAIGGCLVLWGARTPRPWLTGLCGLATGWVLSVAYGAVAAPDDPSTFPYVACYFAGYLLAALAIGPFLAPKPRLVIYGGVVAVALVAAVLHTPLQDARIKAQLQRLTVPLLLPEVPGYQVDRTFVDVPGNQVSLVLRNQDGLDVSVRIQPLPAGFDPPGRCVLWSPADIWIKCTEQVGPDLWRISGPEYPEYLVRRDNVLIVVRASTNAPPDTVLAAIRTLHPVTAEELVPRRSLLRWPPDW